MNRKMISLTIASLVAVLVLAAAAQAQTSCRPWEPSVEPHLITGLAHFMFFHEALDGGFRWHGRPWLATVLDPMHDKHQLYVSSGRPTSRTGSTFTVSPTDHSAGVRQPDRCAAGALCPVQRGVVQAGDQSPGSPARPLETRREPPTMRCIRKMTSCKTIARLAAIGLQAAAPVAVAGCGGSNSGRLSDTHKTIRNTAIALAIALVAFRRRRSCCIRGDLVSYVHQRTAGIHVYPEADGDEPELCKSQGRGARLEPRHQAQLRSTFA